jgi:enhancing lycopene biosynthesis protein 2
MVNCRFCTGMTDLKDTDEIVKHIGAQHLNVPDDEKATYDNTNRLVREVAMCWQRH